MCCHVAALLDSFRSFQISLHYSLQLQPSWLLIHLCLCIILPQTRRKMYKQILKNSCAFLLLDSVAGMSDIMMKEAAAKTEFWNNLDYASIRSQRSSVTTATCTDGSAGGYACSNVDMKSFMALENIDRKSTRLNSSHATLSYLLSSVCHVMICFPL